MSLFRRMTSESAGRPEDDIEAGLINSIFAEERNQEARQRGEPSGLEAVCSPDAPFVWPDGEITEFTNPDDTVTDNTSVIQTITEDRPEALPPKQVDEPPELTVNKITWPLTGLVTDPGRYLFRFGCLTISADDLAIWKAYPNAAFTLIRTSTPQPPGVGNESAGDEFRLGTFELRTGFNYSESEK
jgi:hypothetical protein